MLTEMHLFYKVQLQSHPVKMFEHLMLRNRECSDFLTRNKKPGDLRGNFIHVFHLPNKLAAL